MSGQVAAATGLALATASLYAVSNVLKLTEAEKMPVEYAMTVGLLTRLARRPRWLAGLGCDACAYVTHAAALGLAAVVYVEPLLATSLLLSLFVGAAFTHRRVHRQGWLAALILTIALALFLYEVSPTGGNDTASTARWIAAGSVIAVVIVVCVMLGRARVGPRRAALFGVAAGMCSGTTAVLTKSLVHYLGDGVPGVFMHWEPFALVVTAVTGLMIAQSALQTGALGASVGAIESLTVITGSVLGIVLLDESISSHGPFEAVAVAFAIVGILWGIITLARAEQALIVE